MPIYEYKCLSCGNRLEIMQKISEDALTECPRCAGKLEKQWSLSGFQFKGSGWYVSDYGNRNSAAEGQAESGTEAKLESKSDGKSDGGTEGKTSEKPAANSEKQTETAKKSVSGDSTAGASGASQPASKISESKPIAKTD